MFLFALYHYAIAGIMTEELMEDIDVLVTLAAIADFAIAMTLAKAFVLYVGGKLK